MTPVLVRPARSVDSADLAKLGGLLQRVDDLIAAGTLDGEELNAADFQIAPSIRLAMTFQDLRPLI